MQWSTNIFPKLYRPSSASLGKNALSKISWGRPHVPQVSRIRSCCSAKPKTDIVFWLCTAALVSIGLLYVARDGRPTCSL